MKNFIIGKNKNKFIIENRKRKETVIPFYRLQKEQYRNMKMTDIFPEEREEKEKRLQMHRERLLIERFHTKW